MKVSGAFPEDSYGAKKVSYKTFVDLDGFLIIKIFHDNKQARSFIRFHSRDPHSLLCHLERLSRSPLRAEYYLSEIINKHRSHFESNKVKFIEL
jgi:hypothetical protein